MPDAQAAAQAEEYLQEKMKELDSCGGIVECVITGMPVGVGEPVFDKLSANLGKAILSIGAVKGFGTEMDLRRQQVLVLRIMMIFIMIMVR